MRRLGSSATDTIPIAATCQPAGSLNPASMRSLLVPPTQFVPRDLTEASRLRRFRVTDSLWSLGARGEVDDGGTPRPAGRPVLRVLARTACAGRASAALDRPFRHTRRAEAGACPVL